MKFVAQQEDLAYGLRMVGRAVSGRTTLPILSGVLLETNEDHLRLVGTDLELSIECLIPATIERSGAVVLSAHYFGEIVNRIPGGPVHIEVSPEQYTAQLSWAKSQFIIHGSSPDQFPALPTVNPEQQVAFNPELFREMTRQTMFAVSGDETRPMLTGVQFTLRPDSAHAIATDGFRIAYRKADVLENPAINEATALVVPGRALRELARISGGDVESATMSIGQSQISFELGEVRFLSRLLEGEYPHVLELIPREYATSLVVDTQEFHDACERASLISDSRQRSYAIKLEVKEDHLIITSNAPDVGRAYEELPAEVTGDTTVIAFNGRYIIDGLKQVDTEQVRFEISGALSPSRLSPVGHEDFFYIVLPMRNA